MNTFEAQPFADINEFASVIGTQNHQYDLVGEIKHPEVVSLNRNKIAAAQREQVDTLGQLASELPYEELVQAHLAAENELQVAEASRSVSEEKSRLEILGVHAWAARLEHEFGLDSELADQGIADRIAEISETNGASLDRRISELRQTVGCLSVAWEVAGEAWPVPHAFSVQGASPSGGTHVNKSAGGAEQTGKISSANGSNAQGNDVEAGEESASLRIYGERQIEQPDASVLIAAYLAQYRDRTVTVDELVEFLYGHCSLDGVKRKAYRSRVTTLMGPQIQGEQIQNLLEPRGLVMKHGWRIVVDMRPQGIIKQVKRHRVYRTESIVEANGFQNSFTEYDFNGIIVDEAGELVSSEQNQLLKVG